MLRTVRTSISKSLIDVLTAFHFAMSKRKPLRDYGKWVAHIREWAKHSLAGYEAAGQAWLWELWNEPDIFTWQGTFGEYCKCYHPGNSSPGGPD